MPGPLMAQRASSTAAPVRSPTDADIDAVVETAGGAIDKVVQMNTPSGAYSAGRLNTFRDALQSCMDVLSPGTALQFEAPPRSQGPAPMPLPLVQAYLTVRSAVDAWEDSLGEDMSDEVELPDALTLTDDTNLSLTVQKLKRLLSDKRFTKWAKSQMQTTETPTKGQDTVAPMRQTPSAPALSEELSMLFGTPTR